MDRKMYATKRRCSPSSNRASNNDSPFQSCFTWQSLERIARRYNETNPHDKIVLYRNREQLWRAIKKKMPQCNDEKCWAQSRFLRQDDREAVLVDFKPPIPLGQYTWLTTEDIERVLRGYVRAFPKFDFMGAHPLDFETYDPTFHPLSTVLDAPKRGKTAVGLVLNLDKSNDPGSHWVAVYFDFKTKTMEYFDSFGVVAPKLVRDFYEHLKKKGWTYKQNKYTHQRKNTECGVYAIHFIVKRLLGQSFDKTVEDIIGDAKMNANRQEFFDPLETYKSM